MCCPAVDHVRLPEKERPKLWLFWGKGNTFFLVERQQEMNVQTKHHVEKVWVFSPNQIVRNKINKSIPQGETKIIEKNKKGNHSPTQDSGLQDVFLLVFSAQQVLPNSHHLVTTKASSQQSEPSVHLARCGGDVYLCRGVGLLDRNPKNGACLGTIPPTQRKSHQYYGQTLYL